MNDSPPKEQSPIAKARESLSKTPEQQWRRELSSDDPEQVAGASLALGRFAAAEGDLEQAKRLLEQAATSQVRTVVPRALVQLVPVLEALGHPTEADEALHDALADSDPQHTPDVILDVAASLVGRRQPDRAIQVLKAVVQAWTRNERASDDGAGLTRAIAALRLGNLLHDKGDAKGATHAWELAVSANFPAVTPEAALRLADAFVAEHETTGERPPAEIEELYRVAIDFDHPVASPEARLKLADFYMNEEQPSLAARELETLARLGGEMGERASGGLERARAAIGRPRSIQRRLRYHINVAARTTKSRVNVKPKAIGKPREIALIVGAGTGGKYLLRDLNRERYEVVGWVDDGSEKGITIGGLPVLGTIDQIPDLLDSIHINTIYIAIPTMSGARRKAIVEAALDAEQNVKVRNLPSMFELRRRRNLARQLRDVRVEETIGSQPMRIDREAGAVVRGQSVMIVGAASTIGSELGRQIAHARARYLSLVDRSTMALHRVAGELQRDREFEHVYPVLATFDQIDTMRRELALHKPEVVFHVAGHSHAPIVEEHALEAMRTDVVGTWEFARLCGEAEVKKFVFVSSEDAAEPNGVFSASKALAERSLELLAKQCPQTEFVAVRVGNIYRASGSVVEVFENQIATGGPVTVTDLNAKRRFMRVELATQLLLRTAAMGGGGLFALNGEEEISIKDLADWMIRLRGYKPEDIEIEVIGNRRWEKRLGHPYSDRERPIPTDVPEVIEIKPPDLPPDAIEEALTDLKEAVLAGDSPELLHLLHGSVRRLLKAELEPMVDGEPEEEESGLVPW
jgi:FlaA1/EpsC-like NDP-sugar epimerase